MTSSTSSQFESLKSAVLDKSSAANWIAARAEWDIAHFEEDASRKGVCICGQPNLTKLFTIRNRNTGDELYPIGSSCIEHFGRRDLDAEADLLPSLSRLRESILVGGEFDLAPPLFSKALFDHFLKEGVFTPDRWNGRNGQGDYDFLMGLFRKRDKDSISDAKWRKASTIISKKIVPYLRDHAKLS